MILFQPVSLPLLPFRWQVFCFNSPESNSECMTSYSPGPLYDDTIALDCESKDRAFLYKDYLPQMFRSIAAFALGHPCQIFDYAETSTHLQCSYLHEERNNSGDGDRLPPHCSESWRWQLLNLSSMWQSEVNVMDQILSCFSVHITCPSVHDEIHWSDHNWASVCRFPREHHLFGQWFMIKFCRFID